MVAWEGEQLTFVGRAAQIAPDDARDLPPSDRTILPGLVDVHCHGGGGHSFPDATTADDVKAAAMEHRRHGTTSVVASLVTAPAERLLELTELHAELAEQGEIAGIHFEGPFISAGHCGAQNPAAIIAPDVSLTERLLAAGRGYVRTMTIAPEAPGALDVARCLIAAGALPSWGHTSASATETRAALHATRQELLSAGRSATVTHLCNGMAPMHHRDPGPVLEFLSATRDEPLVVELIGDGIHTAPETIRGIHRLVGTGSMVLVTDAMAAAGMPDGTYQLGSLAVRVADGVARLAGSTGAIAGGTAHLIDVVRTSMAAGIALVDAVAMASAVPAAVIGRHDAGVLEAGRRADIVVTDADLTVTRVIRGGKDVR